MVRASHVENYDGMQFNVWTINAATSCAFVGYPNSLQVDWIARIMSWLDATQNGCIPPDTESGAGDANREYDEIAGNREWCSVWETSMAAQLLMTHVRYRLETCKQR